MKITFLGAAREVTGSNILLETETGLKILIDCGLIQGKKAEEEKNKDPFLFNPEEIDFVLLTHAHIDHSGRIPKLYNEGFRGKVYCTKATKELCEIMLPDSGHIQETEIEWENRKRARQNKKLLDPLYTQEDAKKSMEVFEIVPYNEIFEFGDGIRLRFKDAGHMLGSSIIELWVTEYGVTTKSVFTGDLGNSKNLLLDNPDIINRADYLVMESTYGNRIHPNLEGRGKRFLDIVSKTLKRGGTVVIPSFAVGRTQEIVFELDKLKDKYKDDKEFQTEYKEVMESKVYIDSPLATFATEVFSNNLELFDEEVQKVIEEGNHPLDFPGLKFTQSVDESKALNELKTPKIIISASGMCDAGRIKHHLKHNIWDPNNTILFVGYQAPGTLGRLIVDGIKKVKIFGEEIAVNAEIEYIEGYSGHADQKELVNFVKGFTKTPRGIFLVHGDYDSQTALKAKILEDMDSEIYIPRYGSSYELTEIIRKSKKVKHLELKSQRDDKIQFVDTMDNLGNSLSSTLSKLRDYIVADKTFNEDENIWNKEEEYLQKLYKISNAFNQELKFLLDNKVERKTKETETKENYEIPDFALKKNLLDEKPYTFSKGTLTSKDLSKEKLDNLKSGINIKNEPKSIQIKGSLVDPVQQKLEELKRKAKRIEKQREEKSKYEEKRQKEDQKEETKKENLRQVITISPIVESEYENKNSNSNAKTDNKGDLTDFGLSYEEKLELEQLEKELELEIEKEEQYKNINPQSIEELLKEVEEAGKKLELEKEELKQLKDTKVSQELKISEEKEKRDDIRREEFNKEEKKEEQKQDPKENKAKTISKASEIINQLSIEIDKLDENNTDDELIIANIFAKIAEIENLDDLTDEDVEKIKKEIDKMEDKINNG